MILNKYSLNGKMHPHFNFETLYIKFQKEFLNFVCSELNFFYFRKLTYQIKIDIYDNYVCSELTFFILEKVLI